MKNTPYERGYEAGTWTEDDIAQIGGNNLTPEEFYAFQQQQTQENIDDLSDLYTINPGYAVQQAEYLEGVKAGERDSLRGR